jgi:hypothetical protein
MLTFRRSTARHRTSRVLRPDMQGQPNIRLEARFLPGYTGPSFYTNQALAYGELQASANSQVPSAFPNQPNSNGYTSPPNYSAGNAQSSLSNTYIGRPEIDDGSGGGIIPAVTNVTISELGDVTGTFGGPGEDPSSGAPTVEFVNSLETTDTVTADDNGPYFIDGAVQGPVFQAVSEQTTKPYNFNVTNSSGQFVGGTVTVNFTLNLTAQQDNFFREATIDFTSTHLDVTLGTPGGPPELLVTDPTTSTTLYSGPFTSGNYTVNFTEPAKPTEFVSYATTLGSYPNGTFNNGTQTQHSALGWTFSETVNP